MLKLLCQMPYGTHKGHKVSPDSWCRRHIFKGMIDSYSERHRLFYKPLVT